MVKKVSAPTLVEERKCWALGERVVVGVDEVGKGAWAGPLSVGAVVVPSDHRLNGIRDSKMLKAEQREKLYERIDKWALTWSVGHASARECDELGMSQAQILATKRAFELLAMKPDRVLLDGKWNYVDWVPCTTLVGGDARSLSIAAASVMAKVTRDRIMIASSDNYHQYDFCNNKGYPTPRHLVALAGYGPSAIHRRSWSYMNNMVWSPEIRTLNQEHLLDSETPTDK